MLEDVLDELDKLRERIVKENPVLTSPGRDFLRLIEIVKYIGVRLDEEILQREKRDEPHD